MGATSGSAHLVLSRILAESNEVELVGPKDRVGKNVPGALGAQVRFGGMAQVGQRGVGREEGLGDGFGAGGRSGELELRLDFDGAEDADCGSAWEQ